MASRPQRLLTDHDLHLFNEGTHRRLYRKMGAHLGESNGRRGTHFAVWAPNARRVSVIGDFNQWQADRHSLDPQDRSGIWAGFSPEVGEGALYKYHIVPLRGGHVVKADPFGFRHEVPSRTASVVHALDYRWGDGEWMRARRSHNGLNRPVAIYEVHLDSWMRVAEEGGRPLTYRELARKLTDHVKASGFTHVEFMPVMEHPFDGSWGYQVTGYFAPTSRYGSPQDFMALIDHLHQHGVGVILDWVPSHFPNDDHGLARFDGTHLFEHADPKQGLHMDWGSLIFNYGRHEVRSFLISNALFWLDRYHVDGLRVDAVASMLYLDYSRAEGEWVPNRFGGRENLDAIDFLRELNRAAYDAYPDAQVIAEESTAWPMVSRPTYVGGLGFGLKWDMGWMHDTLQYMRRDPAHRRFHHDELTFRAIYQYAENYVLPLSHDEVAHGKGSLLEQMSGDDWQKFANVRLLLVNMWAQPGKKLLFMGGEFAQRAGWSHQEALHWHELQSAPHRGVWHLVRQLNDLYRREPALHELDCHEGGFHWLDANDADNNVVAFLRSSSDDVVAVVLNCAPVLRHDYRIGVPRDGRWRELLNSDALEFGGSGCGNLGGVTATPVPWHGQPFSVALTLPPLAAIMLRPDSAAR